MKSNKQRRAELQAKRTAKRKAKAAAAEQERTATRRRKLQAQAANGLPVNHENLARDNSYSAVPAFVARGFYLDVPFVCCDCGCEQIWTAAQQKWWYEVAKGSIRSTAVRCRPCRRPARGQPAEDQPAAA